MFKSIKTFFGFNEAEKITADATTQVASTIQPVSAIPVQEAPYKVEAPVVEAVVAVVKKPRAKAVRKPGPTTKLKAAKKPSVPKADSANSAK